jgi:DNA-binding NtrC family response regulator
MTIEEIGVFAALHAPGAYDAIHASENWRSSIEVLVTDIVMPGMHGNELARLIRKARPGIGLVLTSGYTDHALSRDEELGDFEFLNKPFTIAALTNAVGRAADSARRAAGTTEAAAGGD